MKKIVLITLGFVGMTSFAQGLKRPDTLNWVCMEPPHSNGYDNYVKNVICKKQSDAFDRAYAKKQKDEKLANKLALMSFKWQKQHPKANKVGAWLVDPKLKKLNDIVTQNYKAFGKVQDAYWNCIHSHRKDIIDKINVYSAPDFKSKKLGQIEANAARLYFFVDEASKRVPFHPDSYDPGAYTAACHTMLANKAAWFEFPKGPFPEPAWVNFEHDWHVKESPTAIHDLIVKNMPGYEDGFWIKEIRGGFIIGRREMPYDMGDCGPADGHDETMAEERARLAQEKAEADKEPMVRIPVQKAYGKDGHIVFSEKYTRGC